MWARLYTVHFYEFIYCFCKIIIKFSPNNLYGAYMIKIVYFLVLKI